ncbi:MFS transporter [Agaricicola taiwanensis]|uniref:MFS transporter n=2 Tax=Agaricicola taiwanensis TaxID=591372 RepID=A0A8J2YIL5_9RHOB|nr:MFS transporter [Agaricicola taiwanensis]
MISFGPRSAMGLFMTPISGTNGWGRDVFGLAIALQNLVWGIGQPFAGAVADRFGPMRVLMAGGLLYAVGLALMASSSTPLTMDLTAGVLIGLGLSGSSFNLVLGAFGKLLPTSWRPVALGAGTAAGSFGQFLFAPLGISLINSFGWQGALLIFASLMLLIVPLSVALATRRTASADGSAVTYVPPSQSIKQALREAFAERSYVLLVLGFFTCGFQLAFITTHLPPYLADKGISASIGAWTIAMIGLANIVGSLSAGWLSGRRSKRLLLVWNYFARGLLITAFILLPTTPATSIAFGVLIGILWLSTVPPTSGLVALMFGTGYMTMLYGFAFFSHQVGAFFGVWLGGVLYETTGSYDLVWWFAAALGYASALINLPIKEQPVARLAGSAA